MTESQIQDGSGLTVITTHVNADFDAVASMLAAQKLYPNAIVVFPGSQDKNLRNFFITSMVYLFNIKNIKDIAFSKVKKLVLVDTRQPHRIGQFSELLARPEITIHVYDHHPPRENDIRGDYEMVEATGATVTLIGEMIRERGINLSPDEATVMCMGIYEDTGSFTFSSTTPRDLAVASFLLSKGADLNVIANMITREINAEQLGLLNDMIQEATHQNINGVDIVFTSVATASYVPDFAFLVHKMVAMENIDVIFALALMENKVYIVGRSRIPEVDVGAVSMTFGGGGHPYAAAATVKENTLVQVRTRLVQRLHQAIKPSRRARNLMSSPPIAVDMHVSCKRAAKLLTQYNVNALLVMAQAKGDRRLVGIISRQVIEKALYHHLDALPVSEYMTTDFVTVGPDGELSEIQEKIIENKQRILPVVERHTVLGVITRTDLLNILVRQSQGPHPRDTLSTGGRIHARKRNIVNFVRERLSAHFVELLTSIGEAAHAIGCEAYVVGGFVRDLFLYRPNEDIDIVIEGNGIAFAKAYAKRYGARVHAYEKFGTAVIIFPDGFKIDVASARLEYYQFPAALPVVEKSSIKLDLLRRDFTINTLAIQLTPGNFGVLIDFFSAQKDIKEKVIRVLQNLSFVEDPTRVFRAIRFEQRFGFTIGKLTEGLIENAVRMDFFKRLSGRRLFAELRQILEEENPTASLKRLDDFKLLPMIHPDIQLNSDLVALFERIRQVLTWHDLLFLEESYMKWAVYFMGLIRHFDKRTTLSLCRRFKLVPRHQVIFSEARFQADRCRYWFERKKPERNSVIYSRLINLKTELILYIMGVTRDESVKRAGSKFFTQLRFVEISVTGKDLLRLKVEPGPRYTQILKAVLHAKLDGLVESADEEQAFVREYVRGV